MRPTTTSRQATSPILYDKSGRPSLTAIYSLQRDAVIAARRAEVLNELARLKGKIRRHPGNPALYASIAGLYCELGDHEAVLAALRKGITASPAATALYWQLAKTLHACGQTQEAASIAASGARKVPRGLQFRFFQRLISPVIYDTEEEISAYRRRFIRGLKVCAKEVLMAGSEELRDYQLGLRGAINFDLAYQGYDNLELQKQYGNLVHHIMRANYPQWSSPISMPDFAPDGRIRVGFVSSHFFESTVARQFIGWLENLDRTRFQIHSYYTGSPQDSMTKRARESSEAFVHSPDNFEALCRQIRRDRLHAAIFVTASKTSMAAALRLAPVQCTAIGHPLTSGLPTMDYFLSSELMEPPDAQQHYSERLVLFPGIGICIDRPPVPRAILSKPRSAWGIPDDAVVFLCCQSLVKYLPRHDHVFPAIALRVPKAKFVFLAHGGILPGRFQTRLQRAFSASGLSFDDYCLMLPAQSQFDYWNLNLVSDVFLDSFGWSGNMTSLDAIACGPPIVTLPGKLMRGRHSHAILTQLGITETIASDETDYIGIAARLGLDTAWRRQLSSQIARHSGRLFSDKRSVRALEKFLSDIATPREAPPDRRLR